MVPPPAHILVVEDDVALLAGLCDLLEDLITEFSVSVTAATNGHEGLAALQKCVPDLIISDINMPLMDGYEFLEAVRLNTAWLHIPFIFLTARGKKQDVQRGRLSGAQLYLTKPFNSQEVVSLVTVQLSRAQELESARSRDLGGLKQQILQVLNHEFRTPLTYVTAYYEMLAEGIQYLEDPSMLQEYLLGIQLGSERLSRLVEQLIIIVALRMGQLNRRYETEATELADVGPLLSGVVGQFAEGMGAKDIALQLAIEPGLGPVWGIPAMLSQLFYQLLDNAVKFTGYRTQGTGVIEVKAALIEDRIRVVVADNGPGFPAEVERQLFDLFFQFNREVQEQQGAGTGLTIAQGLARLHGGRIEARGNAGIGATFITTLPRYQGQRVQLSRRPLQLPVAKILIVEDDPFLLTGLNELLHLFDAAYHFETMTARNGADALNLLRQGQQPDLIISDIMMPLMDGYALLEAVRDNPEWVQIPFIFLTARGERHDIYQGRRVGAEEYVTKPYDGSELLGLIETQLNRYFQVKHNTDRSFAEFKRSILALLKPDLRTPLQSVNDFTSQLTMGIHLVENEAEMKSSLEGLKAASRQLSKVIEDFMSLAELKSGEALNAYHFRATWNEALQTIWADQIQRVAFGRELYTGRYDIGQLQALPPIFGDPEALNRALERVLFAGISLLGAEEYPLIKLSSRQNSANTVQLTMQLRPLHLPPDEAAEINALFSRQDETIIQNSRYGTALAVAAGLIDLHEGRIKIDNEAQQGCTFMIELPLRGRLAASQRLPLSGRPPNT